MSSSIGHTFLYNIIILFVIIVFAFISGILSYYKAFKVNNRIVHAIEKFEGYNKLSKEEIDYSLGNYGYSTEVINCNKTYKNMNLVEATGLNSNYRYCIYIDELNPVSGTYYTFGVLTYMNLDLPIINVINIPVFTRTNRIYKFTKDQL